jgi:hypothetical protein
VTRWRMTPLKVPTVGGGGWATQGSLGVWLVEWSGVFLGLDSTHLSDPEGTEIH